MNDDQFKSAVLEKLSGLEDGQRDLNNRMETLEDGQRGLKEQMDKANANIDQLIEDQARLIEKVGEDDMRISNHEERLSEVEKRLAN